MGLDKLGINGILGIGILVSISSIIVSVVSMINGTHKNEESGKITNYKITWRFVNAILCGIAVLITIGLSLFINLSTNKDSVLIKDFGWRKLIGSTILPYILIAVLNVLNVFIPWGEGIGVHIARIVIEVFNILFSLVKVYSFSTKFMANINQQSLNDVMNKNKFYNIIATIKSFGKKPKSELSSMKKFEINETAAAVNKGTSEVKAFGERQKRRNN